MDNKSTAHKRKPHCYNALGQGYSAKQAIKDLDEAIAKAARPLDPRNWDTRQTRSLRRW